MFEHIEGLPIQHQLTHELVNILDIVADYAQQHNYEMYETHLTKYCAHLASLSQESNMQGALQQAIDGTNCCHGITHYLKGMVCGVVQAYQQFQTALDYFDLVADAYGNLILQHGMQGAAIAHGLEDISSYHIHAAEYFIKKARSGGHSNYGGNKLNHFKPQLIKDGLLGSKDVVFYNSRNSNLTKPSSIYPEIWSEVVCHLKAIEVMISKNVDISLESPGVLTFRGKTSEGLDFVVHYDIAHKRIRSHYLDSEKF